MSGRRHHTLPRFLLKGFASNIRGKEVKTWLYRRNGTGFEANTRNVSVETDFYGKEADTDLDSRITKLEEELAPALEQLRTCAIPAEVPDPNVASTLVTHFVLRTRQLRQSVEDLVKGFLPEFKEHLKKDDVLATLLRQELRKDGSTREGFKLLLAGHGALPDQIDAVMALPDDQMQIVSKNLVSEYREQFSELLERELSLHQSIIPAAMKGGYIDSMGRNLEAPDRILRYSTYSWFLLQANEPLLLGDSACVFETTGRRRFKPIDEFGDDVRRIYLPVAHDRLLVGTRSSFPPLIDFRDLNKSIARCSYDFFVSSEAIPEASHLRKAIGLWAGVLNSREAQQMYRELKKSFLDDVE